ncbi:condensation domain-containing protein [Chitinophaga rhizophila]|uniref:KR domain-containing protein n=1 Tax=Chitinophaga rhizophila TaxID=2866212 RepID=A0ABS7GHN3_9BACT|nr:condensation domain-containing protein [Chitinophaga rhizophila]MBW8687202.1 KR domain-containing protein [Chitinophaga rhizophila]
MNRDIAIIGMGGRFPDAINLSEFYHHLCAGSDLVRALSPVRIAESSLSGATKYQVTGYMENIDRFDHQFFGISMHEAMYMDPHQRLMMEVAYETISNAGFNPDQLNGKRVSVYMGDTNQQYYKLATAFDPTLLTGCFNAATAGRVSRFFNFTGNALMVDGACASSLLAVYMACNDLLAGESEMSLVGGANIILFPNQEDDKQEDVGLLSADGKCKAFAAGVDGIGNGEAVAAILLKPLDKAIADKDHIYAVIKSAAANQDAQRSTSLTAPSSLAQTELILSAWEKAGIDPETIGYIEAHGTGTALGDPIEVEAITKAFAVHTRKNNICAISSVKTNVGHTDAAAGIVGLIKAVLSVYSGQLFPSLHFNAPNQYINFPAAPIYVNTKLRYWDTPTGTPRRAGVSSFGFIGTNCHMVLEQFIAADTSTLPPMPVLLPISSMTAKGLNRNLQLLLQQLLVTDAPNLSDIAYTLGHGRKHYAHRTAILTDSADDLLMQLEIMQEQSSYTFDGEVVYWYVFSDDYQIDTDVIALYATAFPAFQEALHTCRSITGYSVQHPTVNSFVFQYCLYKLLERAGIASRKIMGFGTGKITTDCISGKISLEVALERLNRYVPDSTDLAASLRKFASTKFTDDTFVIELGPEGRISRTLRTVSPAEGHSRILTLDSSSTITSFLAVVRHCYLAGLTPDWSAFYTSGARKIPLPGYSFEPVRCWLENKNTRNLQQHLYELSWRPAETRSIFPQPTAGCVLVFNDTTGIGNALVAALKAEGRNYLLIDNGDRFSIESEQHITIRFNEPEDYDRLMSEVALRDISLSTVYHLGACAIAGQPDTEILLASGLYAHFHFARAFSDILHKTSIQFITVTVNGRCILPEDKERIVPEYAAIHGFTIYLPQEYPLCRVRCIDLHSEELSNLHSVAIDLLEEMFVDDNYQMAGWRNGQRFTPLIQQAPRVSPQQPQAPVLIQRDELYWVTGGSSGVGLELVCWLAMRCPVNILITGRKELPDRIHWQMVAADKSAPHHEVISKWLELEKSGSRILYQAADLASEGATAAAADTARQFFGKAFSGIFHAAGLPGTMRIRHHNADTFKETLYPKVQGTNHILTAAGTKLQFLFLFSSDNALLPAARMSNYGAANLYMDALAHKLNSNSLRVVSVNWPSWRETGMWNRFYTHNKPSAAELAQSILTADGLSLMELALMGDKANYIVSNVSPATIGRNPYFIIEEQLEGPQTVQEDTSEEPVAEINLPVINAQWTPMQNAVAAVWKSILKLEHVDLDINFLSAGGHSLLGLRMLNRLEKMTGVELEFKDLMRHPTILEFAGFLDERSGNGAVSATLTIPPAPLQEYYAMSAAQQRLWIVCQLEQNAIAYNMPGTFLLKGTLDVHVLQSAFLQIIDRHESLRTAFIVNDDIPVQKILPSRDVSFKLEFQDWRNLEHKTVKLDEWITRMAETPFDLTSGCLIRAGAVQLDQEEFVICYVLHHIVTDGWSMGLFIQELLQLYTATAKGATHTLPPIRVQYKDFSVWQNARFEGEAVRKQRDYWLGQFNLPVTPLQLPLDNPRGNVQTFSGDSYCYEAGVTLTAQLRAFSAAHGTTIFNVLFSVYAILMSKLSGQDDIVVGTVTSGRVHEELEESIGMFVNTLAIRTAPSRHKKIDDFIREVTSSMAGALENQEYQFDKLVAELGVQRDGRNPLFDVLFEMYNFDDEVAAPTEFAISPYKRQHRSVVFDLILTVEEINGNLCFDFQYNNALFFEQTIVRFSMFYQHLLTQLCSGSVTLIDDMSMVRLNNGPAELLDSETTTNTVDNGSPLVSGLQFNFSDI